MTKLSVNINKIATLRNARGGNIPDLLKVALDIQEFGAQGITVHPRPDERHIHYQDVYDLKPLVKTEFNIEGYPNRKFLQLIDEICPEQVTLVPDPPGVLTSNAGWNTFERKDFLKDIINQIKHQDIRVSIFVDAKDEMVKYASDTGTDRIELYTEDYATNYSKNPQQAISPFVSASEIAQEVGLGVNAGHDLNLDNLRFFAQNIPNLLEVSIGHALISDALYFGLENTIQMYLNCLRNL